MAETMEKQAAAPESGADARGTGKKNGRAAKDAAGAGLAAPKKRKDGTDSGNAAPKKRTSSDEKGSARAAKEKKAGGAEASSTRKKTGTSGKTASPQKVEKPTEKPEAVVKGKKPENSAEAAKKSTGSGTKDARRRREGDAVKAAPRKKTSTDTKTKAKTAEGKAKTRGQDSVKSTKPAGSGKKGKHSKGSKRSGGEPPKERGIFGIVNACLAIAIITIIALGVRQRGQYAEFVQMREAVDSQTFYEGTTVEGVDVSRMTFANALDYWKSRVEPRYANRTVTLDGGASVTAGELGYSSDYESVLSAAWSAGRRGSLEERYRMLSARQENPVAYSITRTDYSPELLDEYVRQTAERIDRPVREGAIESFNTETYEFVFTEAEEGLELDQDALKRSIGEAIRQGGGSASLVIRQIEPQVSTEDISSQYGLINYAITNASSSSKARLNNIKLAMSLINGKRLAPGETFSFNETVGQRTTSRGFKKATAYSGGDVTEQVGGGICQVSTTLFNAAVKADMEILERHNHSLTVAYVDKGKDATVDWDSQDFKFKNTSDDDVYICCYLTDDKRVRFGVFGKLLPNGESITLEAVTTEVIQYETQYEPSPLLAKGETYVLQPGRNGYKAESYKIRWDANGNQISKELLCKSVYKKKDEIIQYGT